MLATSHVATSWCVWSQLGSHDVAGIFSAEFAYKHAKLTRCHLKNSPGGGRIRNIMRDPTGLGSDSRGFREETSRELAFSSKCLTPGLETRALLEEMPGAGSVMRAPRTRRRFALCQARRTASCASSPYAEQAACLIGERVLPSLPYRVTLQLNVDPLDAFDVISRPRTGGLHHERLNSGCNSKSMLALWSAGLESTGAKPLALLHKFTCASTRSSVNDSGVCSWGRLDPPICCRRAGDYLQVQRGRVMLDASLEHHRVRELVGYFQRLNCQAQLRMVRDPVCPEAGLTPPSVRCAEDGAKELVGYFWQRLPQKGSCPSDFRHDACRRYSFSDLCPAGYC